MKTGIIYNDKGQYCVEFPDGFRTSWTSYTQVITVVRDDRKYIAFSEYWRGTGVFDIVGVHEIKS